jgi:hypothetical protein
MRRLAGNYVAQTSWDPQNPPFGDDSYGHAFLQGMIPVHRMVSEGFNALANALYGAADLTSEAGRSFGAAHEDAGRSISGLSGGTGGRR